MSDALGKHEQIKQIALSLLVRTDELLAAGWTRNTMALDASHRPCDPESYRACYFCWLGAFMRAKADLHVGRSVFFAEVLELLQSHLGDYEDWVDFNDKQRSVSGVRKQVQAAIRKIEAS